MPFEVVWLALLVPHLAFFLCRTVDPNASAAETLLRRASSFVPLGVGPGTLETVRRGGVLKPIKRQL